MGWGREGEGKRESERGGRKRARNNNLLFLSSYSVREHSTVPYPTLPYSFIYSTLHLLYSTSTLLSTEQEPRHIDDVCASSVGRSVGRSTTSMWVVMVMVVVVVVDVIPVLCTLLCYVQMYLSRDGAAYS